MFHKFTQYDNSPTLILLQEVAALRAGRGKWSTTGEIECITNTIVVLKSGSLVELRDNFEDVEKLLQGETNNG